MIAKLLLACTLASSLSGQCGTHPPMVTSLGAGNAPCSGVAFRVPVTIANTTTDNVWLSLNEQPNPGDLLWWMVCTDFGATLQPNEWLIVIDAGWQSPIQLPPPGSGCLSPILATGVVHFPPGSWSQGSELFTQWPFAMPGVPPGTLLYSTAVGWKWSVGQQAFTHWWVSNTIRMAIWP